MYLLYGIAQVLYLIKYFILATKSHTLKKKKRQELFWKRNFELMKKILISYNINNKSLKMKTFTFLS